MDYTKEDLKVFKHRDIKPEQIDRQLANFEKGFDYVDLSEPATIGNGIIRIEAEDEERLNANFDKARQECELLKMVPASGSSPGCSKICLLLWIPIQVQKKNSWNSCRIKGRVQCTISF